MRNEGYVYRETLGAAAAGRSLLEYLSARYRHSSRAQWAERIREGRVRLDGAVAGVETTLDPGQTLCWHRPPWTEPAAPLGFALLYRDPDVLVVAKPRGLPTLPGGGYLLNTLLHLVRTFAPDASPLHRLGRGTSGVTLFARHPSARAALTEQWQMGKIRRRYRALAQGRLKENALTIALPIGRIPHRRLPNVHGFDPGGKPARSRVRVLERRDATTLVAVELVTGRPHQIRIHLAGAGHPLVGDRLYPPGGVPSADSTTLPGDVGYWLHAESVGFLHPRTGDWCEVTCAPPPVLRSGAPRS